MQTLSVLLQPDKPANCEQFRQIVANARTQIATAPVTIEVREDLTSDYHAFIFTSWSAKEYTVETRDIVRSFVSLVVMELITQHVQPQLIKQIMKKEFSAELLSDWDTIQPYIQSVLNINDVTETQLSYKTRLYQQILDYLQEHRELYVDGFTRFRLKHYHDTLYDAIELGIEQYKEDKEYKEFVELLRYFVSMQETRYELVHVIRSGNKSFAFFDEHGNAINLDQLDMILQSVGQEFREEDYVVSALITLAPKRILFHVSEQKMALLDTLHSIFGERLSTCRSCAYCLKVHHALDFAKTTLYNT